MKKISNWIFDWLYRKKLEELKGVPHKIKVGVDKIKSNCILQTLNDVESYWLLINKLKYKLGVKSVQNARSRVVRDIFGKEVIAANPVFSENQISEIVGKHSQFVFLMTVFVIAETALYYLTACLFVPGGAEYMKISVAAFLAILIMFALGYSFEKHFLYRETVERHSKKEITDHQLKHYKDTRDLGYILIALSFGAILFSGFARIFFLENIPANGMDAHRQHSIELASMMGSIFTMLITFIAALFMALTKNDQVKLGIKYSVYCAWHTAHVKRNEYTQEFIKAAKSLIYAVEQNIEVYWQLVIELKNIYRMDTEHDPKFEHLHSEYLSLIGVPGFVINPDIYRKFAPIQCVHEELFKYGILNDKHIQEKITVARELLAIPEEHLVEHLAVLPKQSRNQLLLTAPQSNGHSKEQHFSNTFNN